DPMPRVRRGALFAPESDGLPMPGRDPVDDLQLIGGALEFNAALLAGLDVLRLDRTVPIGAVELVVLDRHRGRTRLRGRHVLPPVGRGGRERASSDAR